MTPYPCQVLMSPIALVPLAPHCPDPHRPPPKIFSIRVPQLLLRKAVLSSGRWTCRGDGVGGSGWAHQETG
eukprot:748400-Hanusia_phi.AAC.14